jgi:tripartite-type tricarboxylate transporter receptor subunit TctC
MLFRLTAIAAAAFAASAAAAFAQGKFPDRQIRFVVPFAPGGGVDATARLIAQRMQEKQGAQVIVENRAGSNGTIAGGYVQQAVPDGYTLLYSGATHVMARYVMSKAPYDPLTDFTPVARTGEAPLVVVVSPKLAQTSLKDIVAEVKKAPDKWTFAVPTLGSPGHLATLLFGKLADVKLTILPFRGTAPALNDVAGGHVPILIDASVVLLPAAAGGTVRAIAITTPKRSSLAPTLATSAESGMPGLEYASWYGMWGPKGMPDDVTSRLNEMVNIAVADLVKEGRFAKIGVEGVQETAQQFAAFIAKDVARNADLLKAANFQPN